MTMAAAAVTLAASGQSAENLERARQAYNNYDFELAEELLKPSPVRKGKRTVAGTQTEEGREMMQRVENAANFMQRVEKIEILDSISVPRLDFFKAYKLPPSAGKLRDGAALPSSGQDAEGLVDYVFTNEGGDYKVWAEPDSLGTLVLVEASKLVDGSWSEPSILDDLADEGQDAAYPFMMADGTTLYYAQKSPDGLGGYDIMVATRDASDGSFLQPQNLGMPYNSPYDDYLLAIDEMNGVGWFATDRNQLGDLITIYLFKVNDLRKNYDPDDEDLADRALLVDWQSTQDPDADYAELLETIDAIDPTKEAKPVLFHLPMDGGVVYTDYSDFRNKAAANMMRKYLVQKQTLDKDLDTLDRMRREYYDSPSDSLADDIAAYESTVAKQRREVHRALSDIYKAERK